MAGQWNEQAPVNSSGQSPAHLGCRVEKSKRGLPSSRGWAGTEGASGVRTKLGVGGWMGPGGAFCSCMLQTTLFQCSAAQGVDRSMENAPAGLVRNA